MKKMAMVVVFALLCCLRLQAESLSWSAPVAISTSGITANAAKIVSDPFGNVVAVWIENGFVKSSQQLAGGSWNLPATTISTAGTASEPEIGIDPFGNITALWLENTVVSTASGSLTGSWGSVTSLSSSNANAPQLAVDSSGNCVAIWDRQGNIESSTKLFSGTWPGSPDVLAVTGNSASQVAIGTSGTVVAVWQTLVAGTYYVSSAWKLISGSWSTAQTISLGPLNSLYPQVAIDSNGNAVAIWYNCTITGTNYGFISIEYATSFSSGSWTAPNTLSCDNISTPSPTDLQIACDGNGEAIALWKILLVENAYGFSTAVRNASYSWASPVTAVYYNLYAYEADIALLSDGRAYLTYMYYDVSVSSTLVYVNATRLNAFLPVWTPLTTLYQGTVNGYPRIAASRVGNTLSATVLWSNNNGATEQIQAATGTGTTLMPPVNPSVVQNANNFGLFTEYYNTVSWGASPSSNLYLYVTYRNGLVFSSAAATILQTVDHNAVQGGSVTYEIATIDTQKSQSDTVTVTFP